MKNSRFNRRNLLAGLGSTAALLPFLPVLESQASTDTPPRRLVLFWTSNGLLRSSLRPGSPGAFDINASTTLQPLAAHADKLLYVEGVDFAAHLEHAGGNGGDHHPGYAMCMTGTTATLVSGSTYTADGPSLDHFIANRLPAGQTPFRSLNVGAGPGLFDHYGRLFWREAGQVASPQDDPNTLFDSLFTSLDTAEAVALRNRRMSVLDTVSDRLSVLRTRLGSGDKNKFDAHLQAITELQLQLNAPACAAPELVGGDSYREQGEKQIDIIAAALTCDLTRVVTMQWGHAAMSATFPDLPETGGRTQHAINHWNSDTNLDEATAHAYATQIDTWYARMLARLCDKLAAVPEGGGSMLDNTTILWCSEHGNPGGHDRYDLPYVIVGGGGNYFDTGRYVAFNGASNNDLYISICHAMGLDDVMVFGDPGLCTGPLPGLAI